VSRAGERRLGGVPAPVWILLALGLALQVGWHALQPPPAAAARDLPPPPDGKVLALASFGEPVTLSRLLMLWLQAFDNQPGISIPFRELDYGVVEAWLERIMALDPRSRYPLLAASRLYAEVPDGPRRRRMLEFVYRKFLQDPDHRWRWLAHAALIAKHKLGDQALALKYAQAIRDKVDAGLVPFWVRDLPAIILEDMGELESARVLIGGLLDSGEITDPNELWFLEQRLEGLQGKN